MTYVIIDTGEWTHFVTIMNVFYFGVIDLFVRPCITLPPWTKFNVTPLRQGAGITLEL
jgi:hypothetical protein